MSNDSAAEKASIIVFSGDMDKVMGAFIIANGAAAFDMRVTMFFAFWGLKAIQKGTLTGKGFFGRMLGLMNRGGVGRLGPSKFNFGGMGRWMFKKMMKQHNVMPLEELVEQAKAQGHQSRNSRSSYRIESIRRQAARSAGLDAVG